MEPQNCNLQKHLQMIYIIFQLQVASIYSTVILHSDVCNNQLNALFSLSLLN
jgi:hypothetical protein